MRKQILLILVGLLLSACVAAANDGPPAIDYGRDVCDHCNMIISEERFAAAYRTTSGTERRFDDIGGMLRYYHNHAEDVETFWVHDYETAAWLDAKTAHFVVGADGETPMGFGILACGSAEEAARLGADYPGSEILTFSELLAQPIASTH